MEKRTLGKGCLEQLHRRMQGDGIITDDGLDLFNSSATAVTGVSALSSRDSCRGTHVFRFRHVAQLSLSFDDTPEFHNTFYYNPLS